MRAIIIALLIFGGLLAFTPGYKTINALKISDTKIHLTELISNSNIEVKEFKNEFRSCKATWYGNEFHGRLTYNEEVFDQWGVSAASLDYPIGTELLVCSDKTCITLKVNDKGNLTECLDLSRGAFNKLGNESQGVLNIKVLEIK